MVWNANLSIVVSVLLSFFLFCPLSVLWWILASFPVFFFFLFFKMFEIFLRFCSIISFNFHNTSQTQCASLGLRSWFLCVEATEVQWSHFSLFPKTVCSAFVLWPAVLPCCKSHEKKKKAKCTILKSWKFLYSFLRTFNYTLNFTVYHLWKPMF